LATPGHPGEWPSLRLLNSYRLFVALVLLIGFFLGAPGVDFGRAAPRVFYVFSATYLVLGLLFALGLRMRHPGAMTQAYIHFYTDVIALGGTMYASGGMTSGVGILLIVPVAGAGILLPKREALLYAALATLLALTSEIVRHMQLGPAATAYPAAALLGAILFAVALLANVLARRMSENAELARQRSVDLERISTLNERIIQQMESGILVVDPKGRIALANASAQQLLAPGSGPLTGTALAHAAPGISSAIEDWRRQPRRGLHPLRPAPDSDRRLQPQFTDLGNQGTLVALEDAAFVEEQLQQLKLASLGRLTASIAHEIRNPLGAISHSAQLLWEAEQLGPADRRLIEIQLDHCRRVNDIVENILMLSRRRSGSPTALNIADWVADFAREYRDARGLEPERCGVRLTEPRVPAAFDPQHLHQVVQNLCDNSLKHGRHPEGGPVTLTLETGYPQDGRPCLDIRDNGVPIDPAQVEEIFEPFHTTSHSGTGLGLFLARELCAANDAEVRYVAGEMGNRFRIVFADPTTIQSGEEGDHG